MKWKIWNYQVHNYVANAEGLRYHRRRVVEGVPVDIAEKIDISPDDLPVGPRIIVTYAEGPQGTFPIRINGEKLKTPEWKKLSFWIKLLLDFLWFLQGRKERE